MDNPMHSIFPSSVRLGDPQRRTGRSTAIALSCISAAIVSPHTPIRIYDHDPSERAIEHTATLVRNIIQKLELEFLKVERTRSQVRGQQFEYFVTFTDR